jgi:hypothetical protein
MLNRLILILLVLLIATPCLAGGDVYFGKYLDAKYRSRPDGGNASYVAGVSLDKQLHIFKPWLKLETLMDGYNGNGSFHPTSIKYAVGVTVDVWKGTYVDVSRMCWHPIDSGGTVEEYWLVKGGFCW